MEGRLISGERVVDSGILDAWFWANDDFMPIARATFPLRIGASFGDVALVGRKRDMPPSENTSETPFGGTPFQGEIRLFPNELCG